jgi:hypothetical protein
MRFEAGAALRDCSGSSAIKICDSTVRNNDHSSHILIKFAYFLFKHWTGAVHSLSHVA